MKDNEKDFVNLPDAPQKNNFWTIFFISVVIIALILAIPTKSISCSREVTKQVTESQAYIDTEPYTTQECNDVALKSLMEFVSQSPTCVNQICDRNEQYCVDKNWLGNCIKYADRCINYACTKYRMDCLLKINNLDSEEGGTFKVDGYSWNRDLGKYEDFIKTVYTYVNPTRSANVAWSFTYNAGENMVCWYKQQDSPTKSVCENVIAYRDVTKYKDVQVDKQVAENYDKKVNWLYGNCGSK